MSAKTKKLAIAAEPASHKEQIVQSVAPKKVAKSTPASKLGEKRARLRSRLNLNLDPNRTSSIVRRHLGQKLSPVCRIASTAAIAEVAGQLLLASKQFCGGTERLRPEHIRRALHYNPRLREATGMPFLVMPEAGYQQTSFFGMDRFRDHSV